MPSWCTTAGREGARSGGEADNSRGAPGQAGKPGAQTGMPGDVNKKTNCRGLGRRASMRIETGIAHKVLASLSDSIAR